MKPRQPKVGVKKTPSKMQDYLDKMETIGLKSVRVMIPADMVDSAVMDLDGMRVKYLSDLVKSARDDDPRLLALSKGNLAKQMSTYEAAYLGDGLQEKDAWEFDRRMKAMHEAWEEFTTAMQAKARSQMRGTPADIVRASAAAVVQAMDYKAARDDLVRFATNAKQN